MRFIYFFIISSILLFIIQQYYIIWIYPKIFSSSWWNFSVYNFLSIINIIVVYALFLNKLSIVQNNCNFASVYVLCVCMCVPIWHREREMVLNYGPGLHSLINIDIEHIFLCLLAICITSLMKYLNIWLKYFTHFYFYINSLHNLYILYIYVFLTFIYSWHNFFVRKNNFQIVFTNYVSCLILFLNDFFWLEVI